MNQVLLMALPSYTTDHLQPLDIGFFAMLKSEFRRICVEARMSSEAIITRRENIPSIIGTVLDKPCFKEYAKSAFTKAGIHPFNPGPLIEEANAASR